MGGVVQGGQEHFPHRGIWMNCYFGFQMTGFEKCFGTVGCGSRKDLNHQTPQLNPEYEVTDIVKKIIDHNTVLLKKKEIK